MSHFAAWSRIVVFAAVAAAAPARADVTAQVGGDASTRAPSEESAFLLAYEKAFNSGDADGLASMWTEDAMWVGDSAEPTVGRDALRQAFSELFEASPGARLSATLASVHRVSEGVLSVHGEARVTAPSAEPTVSAFAAVLVKRDGAWLLSSVSEHSIAPSGPRTRLERLSFLVGDWRDEPGDVADAPQVRCTVRWAEGGSFLVRSYEVIPSGGEPLVGTQVIDWDPRGQTYRSWSFDSDGAFAEGTWSLAEGRWVGRLGQTLPDGRVGSATQIVTPDGDDAMLVETVGEEIEGQSQPSGPAVRVVRVADSAGK